MLTSEQSLACDSAHSWSLYGAVLLGDQAIDSMTQYPTQSDYPDTELTSYYPIVAMPSARLGSVKYQLYTSSL